MPMETLRIIIECEPFDKILAGTKTVEYRNVGPFWTSRLYDKEGNKRHYDRIEFVNGYNVDARKMVTVPGFFNKARVIQYSGR